LKLTLQQKKLFEFTFAAVFSALILVLFYSIVSMNGLVMGNDPAVHMEKARIFLDTGGIPLENLGWTPPLFQIVLAVLISFTGATSVAQLIILEKALAVLIDWLLFFSVYLIGSKFFGKKIGVIAAVLLLFCAATQQSLGWRSCFCCSCICP
jgi:asparagine N-glycosylation enzyme membrane subunit Stt3